MARRRKAGERSLIDEIWRRSRGGLFVVVLFSACFNLLKFAMPLYLLQVIDRIPASRSIETLIMLTVITVAAIAAGYTLDIIRGRMMTRWGSWIEARLGPEILSRSTAADNRRDADASGQALTDLAAVGRFAGRFMLRWLDLIWAPLFVFGVYLIHPLLGLTVLVAASLLILLGLMQDWVTSPSRRAASAARREGGDFLRTLERNRDAVGGLQMGRTLTERWRRAESGRLEEREATESHGDLFRTLMAALGQFLRIAILAIGIWLLVLDQLTIGSIFAARVMAGFGFSLIEAAVRNWRPTREARDAYRRLVAYLAPRDEVQVSVPNGLEAEPLRLDAVGHRYPFQRNTLFRRLSLRLDPGEFLLITGQAGSGKTTLTRIIVGFLEPRYGTARIDDVDIARLPPEFRERLIGYMPQHTELFDATIRENIARLGEAPIEDVIEVAKLVEIHEFVASLPEGYDTRIGPDNGCVLSGSQRKRIGMARAFFGHPRLIVLDEPSANLDAPSRRAMERALQLRKESGASIVATQVIDSPRLRRLADRLVTIEEGRVDVVDVPPRKKDRAARRRPDLKMVK